MEPKEDAESQEDVPSSPYVVLQQLSEEETKMAGEALENVCSGPNLHPVPPAHRRTQSEAVVGRHNSRSDSFRKLKSQMQKAWRWGGNSREEGYQPSFNPEVLANQKRQWYQLHSKALDHSKYKEPTSLFEHFVIVGLHPESNLGAVLDSFVRRKKWELEMTKTRITDFGMLEHRGPSFPTLEPQVIFKYPPGKRLPMRRKDLSAFCFPGGVKTRLLERSPSLSDLNQLLYGQEHLGRDDLAFIFSLKVADNDTLYGVCLHVTEIVQKWPGILGSSSPLPQSSGRGCRFLVSAPRCYCVLTRVPFFELHYEMLNSIIAQERLNRITQFVTELSVVSEVSSVSKRYDNENVQYPSESVNHPEIVQSPDENVRYADGHDGIDLMASAIPVDSAIVLTAAAAGIIPDDEVPSLSPKTLEPHSPDSVTTSEASDFSQTREVDKDGRKKLQYFDDCASESSETRSDGLERMFGGYENGHASPETGPYSGPDSSSKSCALKRLGSFDTMFSIRETYESLEDERPLESWNPVRGNMPSEDEEDDLFSSHEKDFGDDVIMEWARENKNDFLQIVCGYHAMPLPERGSSTVFQPLEHLQAILYRRPPVSDFGFCENYLDSLGASEVNAKLAAAEEVLALSVWTSATICRVLSLESVLALITGVLLEKQVVVVCPNLGVLSAIVLSLLPMIRPLQWQSLLLPILPGNMLDFLDAPVPFIVGVQHIPADLKMKTSSLVCVNVLKNQVKTCNLPTLPRYKELVSELGPVHARLSCESSIARRHPVYRCNEVQAEAATKFLNIMRNYLESLCSDLRLHTITSVQSNNDRVSLLLKDSFIDSFPSKDRPFIKLFVDTQQFTVLSDSRLSTFESGGS